MISILKVNVANGFAKRELLSDGYLTLGGRALTARILLDEVKPTCDALGPHNKLIFANGLLAGTPISSSGRISISAKSPLTSGIKESNAGGITAIRMAQLGLRAIVVEGIPEDQKLNRVYETARILLEKYPNSAITCIGPAGELKLNSAGVATIDKEGLPGRYSGRGGLGAVMGSKGLKALVIVGKGRVSATRPDDYTAAVRALNTSIKDAPLSKAYRDYGTAAMVEQINSLNGLPIRNFSLGKDERAGKVGGDFVHDTIIARGGAGRTTHTCMPGCLVACSNVWADKDGRAVVSPVEYETIGLLGPNLDIWDFDSIASLNYSCNDIGIDTIEIGAALGVAMEAGLLSFGDAEGAAKAIEEVRQGTLLGRLIGSGAEITGKVLGVRHIPVVKGQAMPAYDPRAVKGMGVTYATSAMGADHTAGPAARSPVDHHSADGKAALSRKMQKLLGVFDSTGMCLFTVGGVATNKQLVLDVINALYGWDYDMKWFDAMCVRMLEDEKAFNEAAGITKAHHRLPEAFTERKMPGIDTTFDVTEEDLATVFDYNRED